MAATEWIAGYAAAVATGGALVQLVSWRSAQTRLEVKVKPGTAPLLNDDDGEAIFVVVINRSAHTVKLMGMYFESPDGRTFVVTHPFPSGRSFPYSIPPRDQLVLWANRNGFAGGAGPLDVVRAVVWTATDDTSKSKRRPIDELDRWEVA